MDDIKRPLLVATSIATGAVLTFVLKRKPPTEERVTTVQGRNGAIVVGRLPPGEATEGPIELPRQQRIVAGRYGFER